MKVYNSTQVIAEVQIDFSCVNITNALENDDSIMLPYESNDFLFLVRPLINDVIKEAGVSWKVLDYEKSRVYFYISSDSIFLSIEAFPKHYSAIEQQAMLSVASKDEREDGWSDYLALLCMFDDIDDIMNSSYPIGEVGMYSLELTQPEREILLSLTK